MCVCVCVCVREREREGRVRHMVSHVVFSHVLMLDLSDEDVTDIYKQRAVEPEYCFDSLVTTVQFEFDIDYVSPVCF